MRCTPFTSHTNIKADKGDNRELPILSFMKDGSFLPINPFQFINQYGDTISQEEVNNKVYIAEFFFTSCPSICPLVSKQLKRVYNAYSNESDFMILSHTIDPKHDTTSKLLDYYTYDLGIENVSNWHLLTGEKEHIYEIANFSYGAVTYDDKLSDNIMHSGALILIDKDGYIRGMYDGKDTESVNFLIKDIRNLLNLYE